MSMYIYVAIIVVVLLILLLLVLTVRKRRAASPAAGKKAAQPAAAPTPRRKPAVPSPSPFMQAPAVSEATTPVPVATESLFMPASPAAETPIPAATVAESPFMPASPVVETPTPAEAAPEVRFQSDLGEENDDLWRAPKAAPAPKDEALLGPGTTLDQLPAPEPELELAPHVEPTAEEASETEQAASAEAEAAPEAKAAPAQEAAPEVAEAEPVLVAPDVAEPLDVDFTSQAAEMPESAPEAAERFSDVVGASEEADSTAETPLWASEHGSATQTFPEPAPASTPQPAPRVQEAKMSPDVETWTPRETVRPLGQDPARADIRVVPPVAAEPVAAAAATPLATSAIASLTGLGGQHTPHDDPLRVVIEDIVRGWGDLTEDDMKRLEVFRPEKVLAAATATGIPKGAKSEYAAKRLVQIKQYATTQQSKICEDQETPGEPTSVGGQTVPSADAGLKETAPRPTPRPEVVPAAAATAGLAPAAPASETAAQPQAEAVPSVWDVASAQTSKPETAPQGQSMPVFGAPAEAGAHPDDEFKSMSTVVKTADDIMALPPVERPDFVVFLGPPELAKLFARTDDQRLKKSVIDILENVGSPASLEVLRTCLDDEDPEIQVYALEAADRLLGG